MKTISIKCPECGASLNIEDGRQSCYCQWCGAKVMIDDEVDKHVYVDEARIKEAEVKEKIRLKELEIEEDKRNEEKKSKAFKIKLSGILAIVGVLMMIIGNFIGEDSSIEWYGIMILFIVVWIWLFDFIKHDKQN